MRSYLFSQYSWVINVVCVSLLISHHSLDNGHSAIMRKEAGKKSDEHVQSKLGRCSMLLQLRAKYTFHIYLTTKETRHILCVNFW